jgi:hypothetical protein
MLLDAAMRAARAQVSIRGVGGDDERRAAHDKGCIRKASSVRKSAGEDTKNTYREEPKAPLVPMDSAISRQQPEHTDRKTTDEEYPFDGLIPEPCHARGGQPSGGQAPQEEG